MPSRTAPTSASSRRRSRRTAAPPLRRRGERARRAPARRCSPPASSAGDEVIVPANTFVATLEAVTQAGGVPVVVDVGESGLQPRPRAVGRSHDPTHAVRAARPPLRPARRPARARAIAADAGVHVIEDACQAHGAERDGCRAGAGGHGGRLQLLPGQEPRRVRRRGRARRPTTPDARRNACARCASTASARSTTTSVEGYTARLDTIQALVLLRSSPLLDAGTTSAAPSRPRTPRRWTVSATCACLPVPDGSEPVWHLYVVRTADPDALARTSRARHRDGPPLPAAAAPDAAPTRTSATRRGRSRWRRRSRRECLSLPIFPGIDRDAGRSTSSRAIAGVLRRG